jgi:integrase
VKRYRGRGEGSISRKKRRRRDGSSYELWRVCVSQGRRADGKRLQVYAYARTKDEAIARLDQLRLEAASGTLGDGRRQTVKEFLTWWVEQADVRATTRVLYEGVVRLHVVPRLGHLTMARVTPAHVRDLYATLERAGKSPRLRQLVHAVLHRALGQAHRLQIVPRNVTDAVDPPRVPKRQIKVLDATQVRVFLRAAAGHRLEALFVLAIATGMRRGELLALRWEDIDFDAGALSVRRTLLGIDGEKVVTGPPKSARGTRRIDLPKSTVAALRAHQLRMFGEGLRACPWVFATSPGRPLDAEKVVRSAFFPLLEKAELPRIRFHDLRHTAATLLLAQGTHPKVVQERLGHAQISLTLDTYSHVLPSMQQEAAARLDELLKLG